MRLTSLLVLMLATAAFADVPIGGILWKTDYQQARAQAEKEGKLMWVHFGENPG